ncbi:hypothetical protein [Legionella sp. km772]|uniref:hypothetical protein n=1 Tax=Legionella sp. km772 TaxID=2498111 RepID=UPI000F8CFA51|nr:hypothetical protein [Legionella sp. km772]RUR12011.1 hypothetical protein ELY15_06345 [Legionella sp. km772]
MIMAKLYSQLSESQECFSQLLGVDKPKFFLLLKVFELSIPQELSKEGRLIAALYSERHQLDDKSIGQLLGYTNPKRDGNKFNTRSKAALLEAHKKLMDLELAVPEALEPKDLLPLATNAERPNYKPLSKSPFYGQQKPSPILISYRNDLMLRTVNFKLPYF